MYEGRLEAGKFDFGGSEFRFAAQIDDRAEVSQLDGADDGRDHAGGHLHPREQIDRNNVGDPGLQDSDGRKNARV